MYEQVMSLALGNGLWAALFCLLFLYQLKDSRAREQRYTSAIESLTDSLGAVHHIKAECDDISTTLLNVKTDCESIKTDCAVIKSSISLVKEGSEYEF